ncbi:MAG: metallophosphoesterase [Planctomycetaceae bacterium]|nr:metallophosphoesterase [Planctomycetaceae bacterium]
MCLFFRSTQKRAAAFPLKIGLLADSQITSQNGFSNFHYRSKFADALVSVSIRPPALECFLAPEMLRIALNKLTQDSGGAKSAVDVILYLGDAANSGGADEIDLTLSILSEYRQKAGIPIFVVIGNHDYLGAGNIVTPGTRFALLNQIGRPDNPALTKYEVLKRFSRFNRDNDRLAGNTRFKYVDNGDALDSNKDLDHDTGLYLSGVLTYSEAGKPSLEIYLLDSSDYVDSPDWSEIADFGFYGVIGAVSFKDKPAKPSQTGYLGKFSQSSSPQFRLLASHYPKDHLDRITFAKPGQVPLSVTNLTWSATEQAFSIPTFSKTLNQNLEPLLTKSGTNYWVSGHTHVKTTPAPDRFIVGGLVGDKYFRAINVGSTTDYRAHVLIMERYNKEWNHKLDEFVGYRARPIFEGNPTLLASIPKAIAAYGRQHAADRDFQGVIPTMDEWSAQNKDFSLPIVTDVLSGVSGMLVKKDNRMTEDDAYCIEVGATVLGLNKRYQHEAWKDPQTEAAAKHARSFVDQFVAATGSSRDDVIAFLGLLAGAYECDLLPGKTGLTPAALEEVMLE